MTFTVTESVLSDVQEQKNEILGRILVTFGKSLPGNFLRGIGVVISGKSFQRTGKEGIKK